MIISFTDKYSFLSNFYNSPIIWSNEKYPTVEHAFQAAKCLCFYNNDSVQIRLASSPGKAKRLGRKCDLRTDWNLVKITFMTTFIQLKFKDNTLLAKKLRQTKPHFICEGNYWHDNFWGDCICPKCNISQGHNHLGQILMKTRDLLIGI